ncbi:MAG TPA: arylesterase [Acidobacteriota bacterium]|nr:arylesterase [Acidobacteriota bacterium]
MTKSTLFLALALSLMLGQLGATDPETRTILVLGDSLAAGYGVSPEQAFPSLLQEKLRRRGLAYKVINAGISGDTSSSGLSRIEWYLRDPIDILILELGANDGLRGISPEATESNLAETIDRFRAANPSGEAILAGMLVPPNMGPHYAGQFQKIFPRLAERKNARLIPFLLEGVAGDPQLNLSDGIHPTPEGHRIVAENVWEVLEPLLR